MGCVFGSPHEAVVIDPFGAAPVVRRGCGCRKWWAADEETRQWARVDLQAVVVLSAKTTAAETATGVPIDMQAALAGGETAVLLHLPPAGAGVSI